MFVNSGSNVFGYLRMASASEAPDSTAPRVWRMTAAKFLSSSWEPRISRHCTSGRPASIMTENCRVKTARFFAATFLPSLPAFSFFPAASSFALAGVIRVTMICSRLRAATAASMVSAARSPLTFWPARVRPAYANVGIISPSSLVPGPCSLVRYRLATGGRATGRCPMPAPSTTPTPRLIMSCSSSFSDDAPIAVSSAIWRFK